jgi:hypothetical protein
MAWLQHTRDGSVPTELLPFGVGNGTAREGKGTCDSNLPCGPLVIPPNGKKNQALRATAGMPGQRVTPSRRHFLTRYF